MNQLQNFTKGLIRENPILVLVLGTCPTLATTSSSLNGIGMGIATMFVLVGSNVMISLLADFIPDKVRIPAFIVVIASFVTIVDLVMQAYVPDLYKTLLGAFREIAGSGSIFGYKFINGDGILVFILAPGAFMALGYLIALVNKIRKT
jgi:electron transport complex protein RnfE